MRCVDVNVLVYAHRPDVPEHANYRRLLEQLANDDEPLGVPNVVLSGFVGVVTNRRIFVEPTEAEHIHARGNDLQDAYLAAYPLEHNASWLSADRGFARFNRLQWRHPMELFGSYR